MKIWELESPATYIDLDIFERNTKRVMDKAIAAGLNVRPHFKAHKSYYLAKKQLEMGASGFTAAKLSEAETLYSGGFEDILVAFPLYGERKWERYAALNKKARLITTVDSVEIGRGLSSACGKENPARVVIEVDCGNHRCGVQPEGVRTLAKELLELPGLVIEGVLTYNGSVYGYTDDEGRAKSASLEMEVVTAAAKELTSLGVEVKILSGGNSPDTVVLNSLSGLTEIRPGNCFFNDVSAVNLKYAELEDCALRVIATVVSNPLPGNAVMDAGTKTLASDPAVNSTEYGAVYNMSDVKLIRLNEEHGWLMYDPRERDLKLGDKVIVIPNHACVLPNLRDRIYAVRGEEVEAEFYIEARGMNF